MAGNPLRYPLLQFSEGFHNLLHSALSDFFDSNRRNGLPIITSGRGDRRGLSQVPHLVRLRIITHDPASDSPVRRLLLVMATACAHIIRLLAQSYCFMDGLSDSTGTSCVVCHTLTGLRSSLKIIYRVLNFEITHILGLLILIHFSILFDRCVSHGRL